MVFPNCLADELPECVSSYSQKFNLILQSIYLPNWGLSLIRSLTSYDGLVLFAFFEFTAAQSALPKQCH